MINVCAYCRVSTDKTDQANSFEAQKKYFTDFINSNPEYHLVGIFADNGISGTSTAKRVQFNRMIEFAINGKIDLIITKEVSRFARNTVDALTYTRLLKEHNVGVVFLSDNINTLSNDGELRLSIISTIAQEESRKTSERVKWGQKRRMEMGVVFGNGLYGYNLNNGKLTVNKAEAIIVQKMFDLYVNHNKNPREIAEYLNSMTNDNWHTETIRKMLKNEKYCGDLIAQKCITTDYLNHKRQKNNGQKIVLENHHEAIVSKKIFRAANNKGSNLKKISHRKYWCSGKLLCTQCSRILTRHYCKSYVCWRCKCSSINENIIKSALVYLLSDIADINDLIPKKHKNLTLTYNNETVLKSVTDSIEIDFEKKYIFIKLTDVKHEFVFKYSSEGIGWHYSYSITPLYSIEHSRYRV